MPHRCFARVVTAGLVGLVGMSVGCDKASGPTAPAAQTATAVSTNTGLTVTAISPRAGLIGEEVRLTGIGFLSGATVTLDGIEATIKFGRSTRTEIVATAPAHSAGAVDVVVTNPGGQSGTMTGGFTFVLVDTFSVTASSSLVTPGGRLTVNWVAPIGRNCNGGGDWIAIYKVGDPDDTGAANGHSDLWYEHLCGAASGMLTMSAPTAPGQYEFRYLVGDVGAVARSNPVTVGASASP